MSLFVNQVPIDVLLVIWEDFFCVGGELSLLRVCLALLIRSSDILVEEYKNKQVLSPSIAKSTNSQSTSNNSSELPSHPFVFNNNNDDDMLLPGIFGAIDHAHAYSTLMDILENLTAMELKEFLSDQRCKIPDQIVEDCMQDARLEIASQWPRDKFKLNQVNLLLFVVCVLGIVSILLLLLLLLLLIIKLDIWK
jgi:hypothetical protein